VDYWADTHVHIYSLYDMKSFLDYAFRNSANLVVGQKFLFLTERADCAFFRNNRGHKAIGSHSTQFDEASESLSVLSENGSKLTIVPGRQINTEERIEVLSLGSDSSPKDGTPIRECLKLVKEQNSFAILPWSFGKWNGARGMIVRELIEDSSLAFEVGDPGHRPLLFPEPTLFALARRSGRRILNGSDPLPLKGEESRVFQYGSKFVGPEVHDPREILRFPCESFGKRLSPLSSAEKQIRLRF